MYTTTVDWVFRFGSRREIARPPGKLRPDQAAVQKRQDEISGLSGFDPDKVKEVLRDPKFYHYAFMCIQVETIPPKLAGFGELCPCHAAVVCNMSQYQKEIMMQAHYGEGVRSCPASGMMGPEIVAGCPANLRNHSTGVWDG